MNADHVSSQEAKPAAAQNAHFLRLILVTSVSNQRWNSATVVCHRTYWIEIVKASLVVDDNLLIFVTHSSSHANAIARLRPTDFRPLLTLLCTLSTGSLCHRRARGLELPWCYRQPIVQCYSKTSLQPPPNASKGKLSCCTIDLLVLSFVLITVVAGRTSCSVLVV